MATLQIKIKDGPRVSDQAVALMNASSFSYGSERVRFVLKNCVLKVVNATSNADIFVIDLSDPKNIRFVADLLQVPHVHPAKPEPAAGEKKEAKKKTPKRKLEEAEQPKEAAAAAAPEPAKKKARKNPEVVAAFNALLESAKAKAGLDLSEEEK